MDSLLQSLEENAAYLSNAVGENAKSILLDSNDGSCSAIYSDVRFKFSRDDRDGTIHSKVIFFDNSGNEIEIYPHVVARLFGKDERRTSEDLISDLHAECVLISDIILGAKKAGITPGHLFYFQRGYNSAYTDYASGRW